VQRIAIGDPQGVPAGVYARGWLEHAGLWRAVEAKIVPSASVRAALAAVESGNADVGIVYKTDLAGRTALVALYDVPAGDAPRIVYPAAIVKRSARRADAQRLLTFLQGADAQAIFAKAGFLPAPGASRK
jgi:molybdate transport system substrate-binding protein